MKYLVLAVISGLLLSVSWPTYGIPFFIFFALVPLLLAEHEISLFSDYRRKGRVIFGLSLITFLIWNIITTGWLYNSQNPDGSPALLAVVIPVIANSLLMSLTFQFYHWYKKVEGTYFGLAFLVAAWMSFEKFHLNWEFTWPWLNLGNAFADYHQFIQWYDTLGATGGSFWILLSNVLIFYTYRVWQAGRKKKDLIKNISIVSAIIVLPILISLYKYYFENYEARKEKVNVALLQPELDPYVEKYSRDSLDILNELLTISAANSTLENEKVDFYIAPETAFPGNGSLSEKGFNKSVSIQRAKDFLAARPKSVFLTGASTHIFYDNETEKTPTSRLVSGYWVDSFNSGLQIIPGREVEVYHKSKLVPGVEIFPYINVLKPLLGDAMLNFGGTSASLGIQNDRTVFKNQFNQAKAAPIICYESIYGEYVSDYVKNGANLLAIMTNDSWWGYSQGHKQLLVYAKLRSIELRRETVRAANSGTSAHINVKGDVVEDLPYGTQGALVVKASLYEGKTFYARSGDLLNRLSIFVFSFLIVYYFGKQIAARISSKRNI